jgi:hypothetical protein
VLAGDRAQIRAATVRESVDLLRGVLESSSEEHFV